MTHYVDGFLLPIHPDRITDYQKVASSAGAIWKEHGALSYWECVGDDLNIEDMVSFRDAARCKEGETVVFAWIVYPSREERDRINAAVMEDPRMKAAMGDDTPTFDYKRMAYGGFKSIVEYQVASASSPHSWPQAKVIL